MKWTHDSPPVPAERYMLESRDIRLSISASGSDMPGSNWAWCLISFGIHTDRPVGVLTKQWPREAIERVRSQLDDLERKLNETKADRAV